MKHAAIKACSYKNEHKKGQKIPSYLKIEKFCEKLYTLEHKNVNIIL